ncbi:MAG: alpha-glucosidase [Blastochloris sp.]|nr:alpha-glucosidase [Blastochloris sp.]
MSLDLFSHKPTAETPAWWKEAAFYQIYPCSFSDSNGDGVGDLPGITSKLDYLKKLGIDALWISPIYASPKDDNGYDISDYLAIDPAYGTLSDFQTLSDGLKERGLKLILDQVLNHTSDEHPWFQESRSSRTNPKRDWYIWVDAKGFTSDGLPIPPNNWKAAFEGPTWTWDTLTQQYYLHLFSRKQPDLNWKNSEVREALFAVLQTWAGRGADGFRLDVINMIAKAEGYPDVVRPEGNTDTFLSLNCLSCNNPPIHDYLRELYEKVFKGNDLYAVGETWCMGAENTLDYTGYDAGQLHGAFYFYFHFAPTGREQFENFHKLYQATRHKSWLTVTLGNHDSRRSLSKFGDPVNYPYASASLLATWLLTLPATPFILQGDELGLSDVSFDSIDHYRDIQTINRYHAALAQGLTPQAALASVREDSRDNARTPLPWDDSPSAGFSKGTPWIPLAQEHRPQHASGAVADPNSLFHAYAALLALRKEIKSLIYGDFTSLAAPTQVLAYRRGAWGKFPAVRIILNWSSEPQLWPVPAPETKPLFSNHPDVDPRSLRPWEAVIFLEP